MANIFGILTAVVLAASAFLALKNKGSADTEKEGYLGWQTAAETEENKLKRNKKKLVEMKAELESAEAEVAEVLEANKSLKMQVDDVLATNEKLQKEKEDKDAEAAKKKLALEEAEENFVDVGDVEDVIAEVEETKKRIAELDLAISEKEAEIANYEFKKQQKSSLTDGVKEQIRYRVTQESDPKLKTRVAGVYPSLGFVTLAAGDNKGVVIDSTLDVVRGGQVVGKLLVTTVEARTAAADIVPDSFAEGDQVRTGDQVVPPHKPETPAPVNPDPLS